MKPDIFISYSTKDITLAEAVCEALESHDMPCWVAPRNIYPGQDWSAAIIEALDTCRVLVLIVSIHSNGSEQVKREIENAVSRSLPILPIRVDEVELSPQMRYFIGTPHWLNAVEGPFETHLEFLVSASQKLLEKGALPASHSGEANGLLAAVEHYNLPLPGAPTGIVTLVFTDIQGSTELWEQYRADFQVVLEEHNRLIRESAARWNGVDVKTEGDAFFLVFAKASDAVRFAIDAQLALTRDAWSSVIPDMPPLRVRMGMHTGESNPQNHQNGNVDYFGPAVNRAARVGNAGHGGQIILSESTRILVIAELSPELELRDLGSHHLKGVGEERLWQVCHPELLQEFPPLKTVPTLRHNLPLAPAPFIGRAKEGEQLLSVLRQAETRLITLVGFGGIGKTRLALHVAEMAVEDFEDGVWWVDLAEARDGEDMMQRIAAELRLHLQPQPTVREQLLNFHRDRELLLILDNLEQIPDAATPVGALLKAGPRLKCLTTSRRALGLREEQLVEVHPLPPIDAQSLFVERARTHVADFAVTPENESDVVELCWRLEGLPLALELAASRIIGMTPQEILQHLSQQLRLLQIRAPDLPPRQRALRSAISWSYDLLNEVDKELLARLSVFAGGFIMEGAEAVCDFALGDSLDCNSMDCDSLNVFEGIMQLRRHSFLQRETMKGTQQTRFFMLESVRDYAREKLAVGKSEKLTSQDKTFSIGLRHANYFLVFAMEQTKWLHTPNERSALQKLDFELDNLRAALSWACKNEESELGARLALALHHPLHRRGFWSEAVECLTKGLTAASEGCSSLQAIRATLRLHRAGLYYDMGDGKTAEAEVKTSLAYYRAVNDSTGQSDGLNLLGLLATEAGRHDVAKTLFLKSLSLRSDTENHGRAIALHNLARVAFLSGNDVEAERLYQEALIYRRQGGNARGEAETLGDLGVVAQERGDYSRARQLYLQSLTIRRTLDDRLGIGLMLFNLAEISELNAESEHAIILFMHAERIFRELQSAYTEITQSTLQNIEKNLGVERFSLIRDAAEGKTWEEFLV